MSEPRPDPAAPTSVPPGNALTLDLRQPPTRADLGFAAGRNERAYQRAPGGPDLSVTVLLPAGTLRVPAFVVSADGDDNTPAGVAHERPPERIVVERAFDSAAQAADSLTADAALLGLDRADLDLLLTRVDAGRPPALPQHGTLSGRVAGVLAVSVDVIGHEDPSVQVNYVFTLNEYHNPAIDKVVHDGTFSLDLSRRPGRGDLALRDTYSLATIRPAPGESLTVHVRLADGTLTRAVSAVTSSTTATGAADPAGTAEPARTTLSLVTSDVADAEHTLRADAGALGLDPHAVDAIFTAKPGTFVNRTLTGASTPIYTADVRVEVTLGQPGAYAAALRYEFTYR